MNFDKLKETEHMLQWFSNEPFKEIVVRVEQMFIQQSPTTKLLDFIVTTEPQWLTSVKKGNSDDQVVLVKAGMAFGCDFVLQDNDGTYHLNGVFTWIGVDFDTNPKFQRWVDLDGDLDKFGADGILKERIYEVVQ